MEFRGVLNYPYVDFFHFSVYTHRIVPHHSILEKSGIDRLLNVCVCISDGLHENVLWCNKMYLGA